MPLMPAAQVVGFGPATLPGYELGYVERVTHYQTTQTVGASATVALTMPGIYFDGTTTIMIDVQFCGCNHSAASGVVRASIWEDSTDLGIAAFGGWDVNAGGGFNPFSAALRRTPTEGTKVYTVRGWLNTAGTGTLYAATASGFAPGFMRITRV